MDESDSNFTSITRDSAEVAELRQRIYSVVVPILAGLCLLGVVVNCYILMSAKWLHRSPTPTLALTISLCAADSWVLFQLSSGLILQAYVPYVLKINSIFASPKCFGLALEGFRMGAMLTSVYHLLILALNNYVGIIRPLHYSMTVTPELTYSIIAFLWFLPPFLFFLYFGVVPGQGFQSTKCENLSFYFRFNFRFVVLILFLLPLLLMSLIYAHIIFVILKRKSAALGANSSSVNPRSNAARKNVKAAVTTSLILGTFLFGWMPSVIVFFLICEQGCPMYYHDLMRRHPKVVLVYGMVVNMLMMLKALTDAVIYAARVREIKFAICRMHASVCSCIKWELVSQTDPLERVDHTLNYSSRSRAASSRTQAKRSVFSRRSYGSPHHTYGAHQKQFVRLSESRGGNQTGLRSKSVPSPARRDSGRRPSMVPEESSMVSRSRESAVMYRNGFLGRETEEQDEML